MICSFLLLFYPHLFMLSTADEHLCLFHSNGIVESISIYILCIFLKLCYCVCVWRGVCEVGCVCVCVCVYEGVYIPWSGMAGPKDIHIFRRYNLKSTTKQFFRMILSIILPLVVYEYFGCSTVLSIFGIFYFILAILVDV